MTFYEDIWDAVIELCEFLITEDEFTTFHNVVQMVQVSKPTN